MTMLTMHQTLDRGTTIDEIENVVLVPGARPHELTTLNLKAAKERHQQEAVAQRLLRLLRLPVGWDGYGAGPISPGLIDFASSVLSAVLTIDTPVPAIVPTSDGCVQIEWHRNGFDIELYITAPFEAELTVDHQDGRPTVAFQLSSDFTALSDALEQLV